MTSREDMLAELRAAREAHAERQKAERWAEHKRLAERSTIPDRDGADSAAMYAAERRAAKALAFMTHAPECAHEDAYPNGYCADCGEPVPDFEPADDQIPGTYEIGQAAA
jgi:hypothetical protein